MHFLNSIPVVVAAAAEPATFDVTTIMTDALNTVQGNILSVLAIAVPAVAVVTGAVVAVKFGLKWLKNLGRG